MPQNFFTDGRTRYTDLFQEIADNFAAEPWPEIFEGNCKNRVEIRGKQSTKTVVVRPGSVWAKIADGNSVLLGGIVRVDGTVPAFVRVCAIRIFGKCMVCRTVCNGRIGFGGTIQIVARLTFNLNAATGLVTLVGKTESIQISDKSAPGCRLGSFFGWLDRMFNIVNKVVANIIARATARMAGSWVPPVDFELFEGAYAKYFVTQLTVIPNDRVVMSANTQLLARVRNAEGAWVNATYQVRFLCV